jgi:hypothetical protein
LRFFGGLTGEEAAGVLQVSEQTVMRDWRLTMSCRIDKYLSTRDDGAMSSHDVVLANQGPAAVVGHSSPSLVTENPGTASARGRCRLTVEGAAMLRATWTIALSALWTITSFAQTSTVAGRVVDARTARPLAGVRLSIDDPATTADTDADGRFQFNVPPGEHVVTVSLVGYALLRQPVSVSPGGIPDLTIQLSEGAGAFEEHVTVSGARVPEVAAAPAGVSLHGRELQALRGITLDDPLRALHALPSAAATDDFYSEFAVRGSPFRHVGLVVDGIPTRYLMHAVHGVTDGGSIAMVNSDAVGSVSLMPGSYPQRTGRRLGAQVELETREGDRERLRGRVGLSGTSATFLAEGPLRGGRGSWLASGRRSYLDLLVRRIDPEGSFAFGFTDVEGKVVFDVTPRNQLQLVAITGVSRFDEEPEDLGPNDEMEVDGRSWLYGLTWRFTPSARFALTQRVYATGLEYENRNRNDDVLDDNRAGELGWRADATFSLRPALLVEFGGDVQALSGRHSRHRALNDAPTLTTINNYRDDDHSASGYAQAVIRPTSRFSITPGARVDYWGPTGASTGSPWVTANFGVTDAMRIRGGAGVYRQFADLEQINGIRGGGTGLRPEKARHVDLGVSHTMPWNMEVQATAYARDEADVLWTPGSEPRRLEDGSVEFGRGDAPWVNTLDGKARGIEVVVRRDQPSGLSGWAGYAFGRHRYRNVASGETFRADFDQRHAISLFGHYRLSNRSTIGAKFRYGSNYPLIGYIGEQPVANAPPLFAASQLLFLGLTDVRNTLRLPAYARLDIRADRTFTWSGRRMTLFAEVANVLNRENVRNVPPGITRAGRVFDPTDTLLPIVPSAGFVIEF